MTQQQKAERRAVIANNKEWTSATTVRRAWLRRFLARKSAPKDAPQWIATVLADGSHEIRRAMEDHHTLACQLLGISQEQTDSWHRGCGRPHPITAAAASATPARATVLTLAILLAALEAGTGPNSWRAPSRATRRYLAALRGWGYELSQVEQLTQHDTDTTPATHAEDGEEAGEGDVADQSTPDTAA